MVILRDPTVGLPIGQNSFLSATAPFWLRFSMGGNAPDDAISARASVNRAAAGLCYIRGLNLR